MGTILFESEIEQITLDLLRDEHGYTVLYAPELAEGDAKERDYSDVILQTRLRAAIDRLNPTIPLAAREEAYKRVLRSDSLKLLENNEAFHRLLTEGVDIKYSIGDGKAKSDKVWLVDFVNPEQNEFLAINQFTVISTELNHRGVNKRADIVLFINGLPLVVLELKNPAEESATVQSAFRQLQTYQQLIPSLFTTNAFLVVSDGWFAKVGTLSSDFARFMDWKSADGKTIVDVRNESELEPMVHELVNSMRQNTSIDWQIKESVQAKLRVLVKRILRKYKYPPDDPATGEYTTSVTKVLEQAELLADFWTLQN